LNGTKHLDYLAFKQAIQIYKNDAISKTEKLESISLLKNSMNSKREIFQMPEDHTIRITLYWLLGLNRRRR